DPAGGAAPTRVRAPEFPRWEPPPSAASDDVPPPSTPKSPPSRQGAQPRAEAANGRLAPARPARPSNGSAAPAANAMLGSERHERGERPGGERHVEVIFDQPLPAEPAPNGSPRPVSVRAPKQDRRSLLDGGLKDFRNGVPDSGDDNDPLPRVVKSG